jgi:hypothetical protein
MLAHVPRVYVSMSRLRVDPERGDDALASKLVEGADAVESWAKRA